MSIILKADDEFPFGKYRGLTVRFVAGHDPDYLLWVMRNVTRYKFADNIKITPPRRLSGPSDYGDEESDTESGWPEMASYYGSD